MYLHVVLKMQVLHLWLNVLLGKGVFVAKQSVTSWMMSVVFDQFKASVLFEIVLFLLQLLMPSVMLCLPFFCCF